MPEDLDGIHFGAFVNGWLVAVVSLFQNGTDFQFRKFAVAEDMQGKGIGRELLQYITDQAINNGGTHIWCNARVTATNFYAKAGFTQTGEGFTRGGFDYVIMEKPLQNKTDAQIA
ncbi:GNAT family N-acetyltransferase [Mucilaginibacter myungsuensis]